MATITVTTQADLDAALEKHRDDRDTTILIASERGVWLQASAYGSATVRAYGSATVRAYDSATVRAYGSATVEAYGSATVEAYGSATVEAYGSATVRAYGSATVRAYGSATVRAYGSATVRASAYVAVHLHSARVTLSGGVVIDVTRLDLTDPQTWAEYTGATVIDDTVTLYKAVDADLHAGHGYRLTAYPVGEDVTASDWRDDHDCGRGLHASPHPHQALSYAPAATRMLEVTVPLADLRPIPGGAAKAKARTVHVVREVTLDGAPLPAVTS